jgi:hypothetical protein
MSDYIAELRAAVERAAAALLALPEAQSARPRAPGKWSPKEVIGHLIDSAAVNHQRFVRASSQDDLVFPTYAQDEWVAAQRYREAPWEELVELWRRYNRHIAWVMEGVPEAVRFRSHRRHNLHQIAWQVVPEGETTTLDYLMRDYVGHLKHHLRQVLPD